MWQLQRRLRAHGLRYGAVITFLKICVEAIEKSLPDLIKLRRSDKLSNLGADLFLLYTALNESIICAQDIIKSLRVYVDRMERHLASGDDPYALTGGRWIRAKIEAQQQNLAKVGLNMGRWRRHLQVLDPNAFRTLVPLIQGKQNALDSLLKLLNGGALPLDPSSMTRELLGPEAVDDLNLAALNDRDWQPQELRWSAVPTSPEWDAEVLSHVRRYLATNPSARLDEMAVALDQLRSALLENFSLADVLLRVGDKRLTTPYNGEYFWGLRPPHA